MSLKIIHSGGYNGLAQNKIITLEPEEEKRLLKDFKGWFEKVEKIKDTPKSPIEKLHDNKNLKGG